MTSLCVCYSSIGRGGNIFLWAGYASYSDDLKQPPFSKSPACQVKVQEDPSFDIEKIRSYWAITVNKILANNGIKEMVAWEDGLRGTTSDQYETESVAVNFWETFFWGGISGLAEMATQGFVIIMANPDYLYFDFPYEVNPEERGYYWDDVCIICQSAFKGVAPGVKFPGDECPVVVIMMICRIFLEIMTHKLHYAY